MPKHTQIEKVQKKIDFYYKTTITVGDFNEQDEVNTFNEMEIVLFLVHFCCLVCHLFLIFKKRTRSMYMCQCLNRDKQKQNFNFRLCKYTNLTRNEQKRRNMLVYC